MSDTGQNIFPQPLNMIDNSVKTNSSKNRNRETNPVIACVYGGKMRMNVGKRDFCCFPEKKKKKEEKKLAGLLP